jgi:catechol 2,3-dioxygenase-like lactoylglutathione lyase family enzyme
MAKPPVRLQRANFVVRDLERALEFYVGVLGLSLDFVKDSDAASYSYTVFAIDSAARVRFAVLSAPGQPRVMALTEVRGISFETAANPRRAAIVLETPDIDGVTERAEKAGFTVFPEDVLQTFDGRRGREAGLLDADGNLAVIYCFPVTD